jgi:hypothetical protein
VFDKAVQNAINKHGVSLTFRSVVLGTYSAASGSVSTTETALIIKAYPRQVTANQFNMPNLIGKELIEFYVKASDLGAVIPKVGDVFVYNSIRYGVTSLKSYTVNGVVLMYKMLSVRQ